MDEQAKPADSMNEQYVRETSRVQEHVVVDDDRETSHDHKPELPEVESPEVELDHTLHPGMGQETRSPERDSHTTVLQRHRYPLKSKKLTAAHLRGFKGSKVHELRPQCKGIY